MRVSILQLNINADNFWDNVISLINSNNFDIINLQEVCGKDSFCGNIQCIRDCFEELQKILGERYKSELAMSQRFTSSSTSYLANAIFYKNKFKLLEKNIVDLHKRITPFPEELNNFEEAGRNFIHLKLKFEDRIFSVINAHLAWAKTTVEEEHQTKQGKILLRFLKENIQSPFILTGDFNLDPNQPLIHKLNSLAKNLIVENNIVNTLNEKVHRARVLFPPGAAVDYIFVSPDIKVNKFEVLDKENLSDHLALTAEIEI